ncbi:MAG TPA: Gfo/Idh/MocA family oxidoreductase [Bryobacteraceae bacterium]|nr:Gfo/Idh/MocA family oxidoreductase [Bryobacteraceae bacterium]
MTGEPSSSSPSRRLFLKSSAAATAARAFAASDRIRIAVVGTGGRGRYLIRELNKIGGIEWVAVCDIYDVRRSQGARETGAAVEQYADYRDAISRKDVDAVIVATPDHWHATVTLAALQAGKDVYVEKPFVHRPEDGKAIVKAVRASGRVLQVGTQGRLLPQFVEAKQRLIDTGAMGKVGLARTWYTSNQGYVLTPPPGMENKPAGLDWDRWLGPGPKVPWNPDIYFSPYKWLHYDGGMIMGIGIHVVDSAHHWLGLTKPNSAVAGGGTYFYKDGRDTPDVITAIWDYPQGVTVTFEAECLDAPGVRTTAGVELRGSGGKLWAERYVEDTGYEYTPNPKFSKTLAVKAAGTQASAEGVLRNWLECIRTRQKPAANEVEAYYSTVACHMANVAYRTQDRVRWDPAWDL